MTNKSAAGPTARQQLSLYKNGHSDAASLQKHPRTYVKRGQKNRVKRKPKEGEFERLTCLDENVSAAQETEYYPKPERMTGGLDFYRHFGRTVSVQSRQTTTTLRTLNIEGRRKKYMINSNSGGRKHPSVVQIPTGGMKRSPMFAGGSPKMKKEIK